MERTESLITYVLRSTARTDALIAVANGQCSVQALLEQGLGSESGVYKAISDLENQGLIYTSEANECRLTGTGSIVVNFLRRQQKTDELIQTNSEYWQSHDITVLPRSFQFDLAELDSGWVVRATDTRPSRAEREVEDRLEATTSACVVEPVYDDRHITALLDNCESFRLVMTENVFSSLRNDVFPVSDSGEGLDIRVADVSFELAVTDESLLLSLPLFDGSYDMQSKFVAESERARNWGTKVFEHIWRDAERVDDLH